MCDLKPHVLRYWEQEFPQLKPSTRRGNRRYYQQEDVLLVRKMLNEKAQTTMPLTKRAVKTYQFSTNIYLPSAVPQIERIGCSGFLRGIRGE